MHIVLTNNITPKQARTTKHAFLGSNHQNLWNMQTITFECEVITPMFLAGADGTTPELRPPSIKGALRFWWRAMNGHLPLADLQKKETEIFGGTSGDSGQRSGFFIRIPKQPKIDAITNETWKDANYEYAIALKSNKPYYKAKKNGNSLEGVGYLLYSTWLDGENPRKAIKAGQTFEVVLGFLKSEFVNEILNALYFLMIFGGIGTRVRRGAGSFKILKTIKCNDKTLEEKFNGLMYKSNINSMEDFEEALKIISIKKHSNNYFSHLSEAFIYLFDVEESWQKALDKIGLPFKEFRGNEKSNIKDTPNFGFPIVHRSTKTTMQAGKWESKPHGKKELIKLERRSSPLIFKVYKTNNNEFYPYVIWLNGELIPNDFEIMDKEGKNQLSPNCDIINDFINDLNYEIKIDL